MVHVRLSLWARLRSSTCGEHFHRNAEVDRTGEPVDVAAGGHALVELADDVEGLTPRDERRGKPARMDSFEHVFTDALHRAAVLEMAEVGDREEQLGMSSHVCRLDLELVRRPDVVGVQQRDQLPGGGAHAEIARGGHADAARAQTGRPERLGDVGRAVGRSVVHDDDLVRRSGLSGHARRAPLRSSRRCCTRG